MKIIEKDINNLSEDELKNIDNYIEKNGGLVFHETAFNEIAAKYFDFNLKYLLAFNDSNELIGVCPVHFRQNGLIKKSISGLHMFGIPYGGWIYKNTVTDMNELLDRHFIKKNESFELRTNIVLQEENTNTLYNKSKRLYTAIINLNNNSEEDILSNQISKNTRHNIKRAGKKGVTIELIDYSNLNIFIELLLNLNKEKKMRFTDTKFYEDLFFFYSPLDKMKILVAKNNKKYISALCIIGNKNVMHAWIAGRISNLPKNIYQNELLWWESIKWAKNIGASYYDLCVIEKENLPNIAQFKMGFSKELVPFYYISKKGISYKIINRLQKCLF